MIMFCTDQHFCMIWMNLRCKSNSRSLCLIHVIGPMSTPMWSSFILYLVRIVFFLPGLNQCLIIHRPMFTYFGNDEKIDFMSYSQFVKEIWIQWIDPCFDIYLSHSILWHVFSSALVFKRKSELSSIWFNQCR